MRRGRRLAVWLWLAVGLVAAPVWAGGLDEVGFETEMTTCLDMAQTGEDRRACVGLSARLCAQDRGYGMPDELCYRGESNFWGVRLLWLTKAIKEMWPTGGFDPSETDRIETSLERSGAAWNELVGPVCFSERDLTRGGMWHFARCVMELTAEQALRLEEVLIGLTLESNIKGGE